jgi:hypothetical protein
VSKSELYFYYRQVRDVSGRFRELKRFGLDWERQVLANDAISWRATWPPWASLDTASCSMPCSNLRSGKVGKPPAPAKPDKAAGKRRKPGEKRGRRRRDALRRN